MELTYTGPCGLRRRIQLTAAHDWDYEQIAEFLDVPSEVIRLILIDDAYTPSDEYQATMWDNIGNIAPDAPWPSEIGPVGVARQWQYWESPYWDDAQMAAVTFPGGAVEFYWVF